MNIKAVIDILNKEFDANINTSYYTQIDTWQRWWEGFVKSFHQYQETQEDGKTKERELFTLKMPKKACEDWASIFMNESTKIVVDDKKTSVFLQGEEGNNNDSGVFGAIKFWKESNALIEKAWYSGTGVFVLKIDGMNVTDEGAVLESPEAKIRMEYLAATHIVPLSKRYGSITEVAFVSERTERGKSYIYLEIHMLKDGLYVIENRYYEVNNGSLSPTALPPGIVPRINTGAPIPFYAIISPNIVNPFKHNLGLGCSIFSQAIDNAIGVDLAFNNFCRDFKLGGKKVFYNRKLLETTGVDAAGNPIFRTPDDAMQQLFQFIGDEYVDNEKMIHEYNPDLRVEDNVNGVQSQLNLFSFKCGLGAGYYRFDPNKGMVVTATQYTGDKQELKQNVAKHSIVLDAALRDIVQAILWVGKNLLGADINPDAGIKVEFSDGYIVSDDERRAQDMQDVREGLMLPWEYRVRWYSETKEEAQAVLAQKQAFGSSLFLTGEDE